MPDVKKEQVAVLKLWGRCFEKKALPFSGGVLEQPAWLMEAFDVIEQARAEVRERLEQKEKDDAVKQGLLEKHG